MKVEGQIILLHASHSPKLSGTASLAEQLGKVGALAAAGL
jgi:hypothetical protein